jgi:MFS family permease
VPLLLSRERGWSPAIAGLSLTLAALAWSGASWWRGRMGPSANTQLLLRSGFGLVATGTAVVAVAVLPAVPPVVAVLGWAVAGLGMGLGFPTLSVLTMELSAPGEQGANSASLQLADALATATALALGGSLFAALLEQAPLAAYLSCFTIAALLGALGFAIAPRARAESRP